MGHLPLSRHWICSSLLPMLHRGLAMGHLTDQAGFHSRLGSCARSWGDPPTLLDVVLVSRGSSRIPRLGRGRAESGNAGVRWRGVGARGKMLAHLAPRPEQRRSSALAAAPMSAPGWLLGAAALLGQSGWHISLPGMGLTRPRWSSAALAEPSPRRWRCRSRRGAGAALRGAGSIAVRQHHLVAATGRAAPPRAAPAPWGRAAAAQSPWVTLPGNPGQLLAVGMDR